MVELSVREIVPLQMKSTKMFDLTVDSEPSLYGKWIRYPGDVPPFPVAIKRVL